jgi:hypothetical protein
MFLSEIAEPDPKITRLVTIVNQLKTDVDNGKIKSDWTVDQLLNYFRKYDIIIDKNDLYKMIKKPPLKNAISNIQGDKLVFKGQEGETPDIESTTPDDQKKIVAQMAKNTLK